MAKKKPYHVNLQIESRWNVRRKRIRATWPHVVMAGVEDLERRAALVPLTSPTAAASVTESSATSITQSTESPHDAASGSEQAAGN